MTEPFEPQQQGALSISAVERDTGLAKDTLRVWERRYGFPKPARDQFGERVYPVDQVEKLRILQRLMAAGHRPGKIIGLTSEQLLALAVRTVRPAPLPGGADSEVLESMVQLVRTHQIEQLRRMLLRTALQWGIERFVTELVAPLNQLIGDAWARGELQIFEEHLYSESVQVVLRSLIGMIPQMDRRPYVLLTTFPQEPHGLGLLMVEAMLVLDGCRCVSLGTQTPVADTVRTAVVQQADVVGVSCSPVMSANQVLDGLAELRAQLPATLRVWAGGHNPVLPRKPPDGITVIGALADLPWALADWRAAHGASL